MDWNFNLLACCTKPQEHKKDNEFNLEASCVTNNLHTDNDHNKSIRVQRNDSALTDRSNKSFSAPFPRSTFSFGKPAYAISGHSFCRVGVNGGTVKNIESRSSIDMVLQPKELLFKDSIASTTRESTAIERYSVDKLKKVASDMQHMKKEPMSNESSEQNIKRDLSDESMLE